MTNGPLFPCFYDSEIKVRPVECYICHKPLFYMGDPRHEEEVRLDVFAPGHPIHAEVLYAHLKCFMFQMKALEIKEDQ